MFGRKKDVARGCLRRTYDPLPRGAPAEAAGRKGGKCMTEALGRARALLADVTPLKRDCGTLCAAVCCRSAETEQTGMLLFPGEEKLYSGRDGYEIKPAGEDLLLICSGICDRDERPLSCRIFPLLPVVRENGIRVVTDERARFVCPLAAQGKRALDPEFVEKVRLAGEILLEDDAQRAFLKRLTGEHDELKELRSRLGGA